MRTKMKNHHPYVNPSPNFCNKYLSSLNPNYWMKGAKVLQKSCLFA